MPSFAVLCDNETLLLSQESETSQLLSQLLYDAVSQEKLQILALQIALYQVWQYTFDCSVTWTDWHSGCHRNGTYRVGFSWLLARWWIWWMLRGILAGRRMRHLSTMFVDGLLASSLSCVDNFYVTPTSDNQEHCNNFRNLKPVYCVLRCPSLVRSLPFVCTKLYSKNSTIFIL